MQYDKPLCHYSAIGDEEAVRALLQRGVNVDEKNEFGETPLICVDFNKPNIVKLLLDAGADVNAANYDLQRPLHLAVIKNNLESVKLLIQANADVHVEDKHLRIPLNYAIEYELVDIVKVLSEVTRPFEISELCQAVNSSNEEKVKLLLERNVNVNDEIRNGTYPLLFASYQPNLNITRLLLDHGANVDKRHKENGVTALHQATISGHIEQVKLLIQHGANVCIKTTEDKTALHFATYLQENAYDIIKLLIQHGANCNDLSDSRITPLDLALCNCNRQVIELMLEHGANFSSEALHFAVRNNDVDVINLVLDNGLDVNARDDRGSTVLNYAIDKSLEHCELLLNRGVDINRESRELDMLPLYIVNMRSDSLYPQNERIKNLLVKHIAELKFQNIPVCIENEEIIKYNPKLQEYYLLCTEELHKIEKYKILKDFSLFQLFFQNKNNIVKYAKSEELVRAYESLIDDLQKNFPIYFTSNLRKNFEDQITKQKQIKKTINKLCNIFYTSSDVSENIVKYIKVKNLDFLNNM